MTKTAKIILVGLTTLTMVGMASSVFAQGTVSPELDPNPVIQQTVDCDNKGNLAQANRGVCNVLSTVGLVVFILQMLTFAYFIWGIIKYLTSGGDPEAAAAGRKAMLQGIIGIAAIFGVNAIIAFITNYAGIKGITVPFFD